MRIFVSILFMVLLGACATQPAQNTEPESLEFAENEEGEYDIVVFDAQYDMFLNTRAMPMNYYSEAYYKNRNRQLVTEWNIRANNQMYYGELYAVRIDYDPRIDYGLEFEYKLYNFFMFVEWKYGVDLDGRLNRIR